MTREARIRKVPLHMQAAALRPLSIGEILDVAIKIVWRHAWTLARVVVFVIAPVQIVMTVVQATAVSDSVIQVTYGTAPPEEAAFVDDDELIASYVVIGIAALLSYVATTVAVGACFKGIADAYLGERPSWRSSLGYALRRTHSLLWVVFLVYLLATLAAFACLLPGIWLWVAWVVAIPALLTENVKGTKALRRSFRLVRNRWWPTFGLVLLGLLITGFVSYVVQFLFLAPLFTDAGQSTAVVLVVNTLASIFGSLIWAPLVAAFATILYFDLRVRKEGFDLALLAQRIGLDPDASRIPLAPQGPAPRAWEGGEQPPYWPPPPGWQPGQGAAQAQPAEPAPPGGSMRPEETPDAPAERPPAPAPEEERPPYWPPPPGWRPSRREPEDQ